MLTKHKKIFGFSLVELMAALAVVMILVAIALPRYQLFIASSRQAEAQSNLGIIATLQQTYSLRHGRYCCGTTFNMGKGTGSSDCGAGSAKETNELGFRVVDCTALRYGYQPSGGGGEAENDGNQGAAKQIFPGCSGSADKWTITAARELTNNPNVINYCK